MLSSIKSKIVLKNIIRNIEKNVYLRIVKTNRNLQNKLDISLDTYEEYYNQIEVELIPKKSDLSSENQFINPDYQNKAFFNSSFDEVKKCNFSDNENEFEVKLGNYSKAKLLIDGDEKWENIKPYKKNKDEEEYNRIDKQDLFDIGKLIYRMVFNEINIDKEKINKEIEDENLKDLLNGLLVDNVKERIEWDDYFKHKFFSDNNDTSIDYINILTYLK